MESFTKTFKKLLGNKKPLVVVKDPGPGADEDPCFAEVKLIDMFGLSAKRLGESHSLSGAKFTETRQAENGWRHLRIDGTRMAVRDTIEKFADYVQGMVNLLARPWNDTERTEMEEMMHYTYPDENEAKQHIAAAIAQKEMYIRKYSSYIHEMPEED